MNIILFLTVVFLALVAGTEDNFEIPEPVFEVFHPKGLRISLPDSKNVLSVEFTIILPNSQKPLVQVVNKKEGNDWVYWNPDAILDVDEKFTYKFFIQRKGGAYCKKEGTYIVKKVLPFNKTDEKQGQTSVSGVVDLQDGKLVNLERHPRNSYVKTMEKSSRMESSYSTFGQSGTKPITKSSMSTTSGTFYIKPSGVMEATGYREGSSYDSTRRDGEQWHHFKSSLTPEELENMKNLYGHEIHNLNGFHELQQFRDGLLIPKSEGLSNQQYSSYESKFFPSSSQQYYHRESQPLTTHEFHKTHRIHESSSFGNLRPQVQLSRQREELQEAKTNSEKFHEIKPFMGLPNPLPPQGTIVKATEYIRHEQTVPVGEASQEQHERLEQYHRESSPQKIIQVPQPSHQEYNSGIPETVDRGHQQSQFYKGSIFKSIKNYKVKTPQECSLIPEVDYTPSEDLKAVERQLHEMNCLASLSESATKEQLQDLRIKNEELNRRLEHLVSQIRRMNNTCHCF